MAECVLVFLLFYLYAGGPPPDVNEAHYLGKAKHYWNPGWCPGDQFLESADAHLVFNWTFGWLTLLLPLPAVAWVGRVLTWGLLAWAWRRLSFSLATRPLWSVLSAALFLVLIEHLHMAGEWVVGGVEAKGFAFVLVLLGIEAVVRGRWRSVWLLLGAAAAFHVLVGGWSVVAAAIAWLLTGRRCAKLVAMLPALAAGFALSLPGLVPAVRLTLGTDVDVLHEANRIYVYERLGHHLVPEYFGTWVVVRHLALLSLWIALVCLCLLWKRFVEGKSSDERDVDKSAFDLAPLYRLDGFVAGAIAVALLGTGIYFATLPWPDLAAKLLRFYWYRLSDVALPLGVALAGAAMIERLRIVRPAIGSWSLVVAIAIAAALMGEIHFRQVHDGRPAADAQSLPPRRYDPEVSRKIYADWVRVCRWIRDNTEEDDRFITPQMQQTFKWYAGRSEVANRKDIPQDARSIVEWRRRVGELYPEYWEQIDGRWHQKTGLAAHSRQQLIDLGHRYDAQYVVIDRTRSRQRPLLPLVYPNLLYENGSYAVYQLPPKEQ